MDGWRMDRELGSALTATLYGDLHRERIRAHDKHRDKPGGSMEQKAYDEPDWLPVLTEELGEVAKVLCDHRHGLLTAYAMRDELRKELVQVGAMAAAWIDAIDNDEADSCPDDPDGLHHVGCGCEEGD